MAEGSDHISNLWIQDYCLEIEKQCKECCSKACCDVIKKANPTFAKDVEIWLNTQDNFMAIPAMANIGYHLISLTSVYLLFKKLMSDGEQKGDVYKRVTENLDRIEVLLQNITKISARIINPDISDQDKQDLPNFLDDITRYQGDIQSHVNDIIVFLLDCIKQIDSAKNKLWLGVGLSVLTIGYGVFNMVKWGLRVASASSVAVVSGVVLAGVDIYYLNKVKKFKKELILIKEDLSAGKFSDKLNRQEFGETIRRIHGNLVNL